MSDHRREIEEARRRLANRERSLVQDPRFGSIEYTEWGDGPLSVDARDGPLTCGNARGAGRT